MSKKRIKISELTAASSLAGFYTLGYKLVDGERTSVKLDLSYVQTAYQNTVDATGKANEATVAANTAAEKANNAAAKADTATFNADTATDKANEAASLATTAAENARTAAGRVDDTIASAETVTKLATDAALAANTATENAYKATDAANAAATLANEKAGLADMAAASANTAKENAIAATNNANAAAERANAAAAGAEGLVKGFQSDWCVTDPANPNYIKNKPEIPTLDTTPTGETLGYVNTNGTTVSFRIGDEVRVLEEDEYVFYRLYDLADGVASWQESGSGTALPSNVYLTGANYYNESVRTIKQGYLSNE